MLASAPVRFRSTPGAKTEPSVNGAFPNRDCFRQALRAFPERCASENETSRSEESTCARSLRAQQPRVGPVGVVHAVVFDLADEQANFTATGDVDLEVARRRGAKQDAAVE